MKKSPSKTSHVSVLPQNAVANILLERIFHRIFIFPLYALVAAPYLILFNEIDPNATGVYGLLLHGIAVLSFQPGAKDFNQFDIGLAIAMLFALTQILPDLVRKVTGVRLKQVSTTRRIVIKASICAAGFVLNGIWGITQNKELDQVIIPAVLGMLLPVLFLFEYAINMVFQSSSEARR